MCSEILDAVTVGKRFLNIIEPKFSMQSSRRCPLSISVQENLAKREALI